MSIFNLDRIFHPKRIAVLEAQESPHTTAGTLLRNLLQAGFKGQVHPVSTDRRSLCGLECHPTLGDIGQPVDLAIIATPLRQAPALLEQCVQTGAGAALLLSRTGQENEAGEAKILEAVRAAVAGTPLRLIGPNSLGLACQRCRLNATLARCMPPEGRLAFISQSGGLATAIFDAAERERIGFSYFVGLGSMLDVHFGDVIDYLGNDGRVSSIVMYMEQVTSVRRFMSAARAVASIKPIIALKAGRTPAGGEAAMRHTGAAAGEDGVYEAAFKRAGILRVRTFEELFDCAELVSKQPRPRSTNLVIVSNAAGPAVMAADALADYAAEPARLTPQAVEALQTILGTGWSRANPVDIGRDATPQRFGQVVDLLLKCPDIDGLLVIFSPNGLNDPTETARLLAPLLRGKLIPTITAWLGGQSVEAGRDLFNAAGIPTFDSPERAVRAFMDLYHYERNLEIHRQIPVKLPRRLSFERGFAARLIEKQLQQSEAWMSEVDAKQLLAAYGIPVNSAFLAGSADQAVELAEATGFPVALKIDSPVRANQFHWEGVRLGLTDARQVRQAFDHLLASAHANAAPHQQRMWGITVQKMIGPAGVELLLGIRQDRDFGPVMVFGWGGIGTDVAHDSALALPPLNRLLARRMIESTHVHRLLKGYRDWPPANLTQLEEILIRLSQLITDFAEVQEIRINPLMVLGQRMSAVSVRICIQPAQTAAPHHLIIAPYPNEYEKRIDGPRFGTALLRPIRPEDAPLLKALFATLSQRSIYLRFFAPLRDLPLEMLARFTQVDYDREIAMVAVHEDEAGQEELQAVGRIIRALDPTTAEFSILVGDRWHGKGIGAALLHLCLKIAKAQGVRKIWGAVLSENTQMLALGRKLKFEISRSPAGGEYELSLDLADLPEEYPLYSKH